MQPLFDTHNIRVLALSKDTQADIQTHIQRDGIQHVTLLSDPDFKMIRAFGLEHHGALEFKTWNVMGIPLGVPIGFKRMAIPTTLLIDEQGIVRWIDQATDYRVRGDETRIKDAIEQVWEKQAN
jgi:peroxiredoxin